MARAIWTGSITIGLLTVPVKIVPAIKRQSIAFNQIDHKTGSRVRYQKVAEANNEPVAPEHIVKGYDMGGGSYVIVDDEDLKPLMPKKTKEIVLETFVPAAQIPPVMFDTPYILQPGKMAKPYALLARALDGTGKVGVGRFVMRQKEALAAVRSSGDVLTLSTLVFPDEVVDPATVEGLEEVAEPQLADRELAMANALIEALSDPFDPSLFRDEYRTSVMELIEAKAAGRTPSLEDPPKRAEVVDLAAALEASVAAAQAARGRHPTSRKANRAKPERANRSA